MNILQQEDVIKGLPDNVLMQQAQQPTGELPEFLVVSEIQRREKMRKSFAETVPEQSVKDQVLSSGIAAMNPDPDPLMATAMGAQDPMMGQMQDPMQQQMMQQQMMQDPMQQQMPMQDPMMQDPMMQQQMMAASGGMMPYRMYNGSGTSGYKTRFGDSRIGTYRESSPELRTLRGRERARLEDLTPQEIEEYLLNEQRKEDSQAFLEKLEEDQSSLYAEGDEYQGYLLDRKRKEDSQAFMENLYRQESVPPVDANPELAAFLKGVNNQQPISEYERLTRPFDSRLSTVNDEMLVGQINGSNVFRPNDGTSPLVQDRFPGTQSILGPNLGNAVARQAITGVDGALASSPANSDDVYSVLQDIKNAGIEAGEVIGRDAGYLSDRGPEFVEAGEAGLNYIANSRVGQALGSAKDFLTTPILESYPEANIFAAENNTQLPGFLEMLQRNSSSGGGDSSLPEEIAEEPALGAYGRFEKSAVGYVDRFSNMLNGNPSWYTAPDVVPPPNALKEDLDSAADSSQSPNKKQFIKSQAVLEEAVLANGDKKAAVDAGKGIGMMERIGTEAGDPEGLLKSLFGRSYKPMDDGALALINLGAGIAKGDVAGGMLGAVQSIGESRDRDRKDMLAKAQAEFYASGGRGAKDTLADLRKAAQLRVNQLGANKYSLYKELTGKTDLTNDDLAEVDSYLINRFIDQIAQEGRVPASAVGRGSASTGNLIQEANSIKRMFEGTSR
tara:strand:- start:1781 stop:3964 length:2184 start_codon:yes stop_codon:yes gene_type:complete